MGSSLSKCLHRTQRSVKWMRESLGCYRTDFENLSYESISKYIRGNIQQWKNDSMKKCEYRCLITGSKDFQIHHLYGVSNIIKDIVNKFNIELKDNFSDYTKEELSFILDKFVEEQNKHPLGVCVSTEIHKLFHSSYGQYYNTKEQWEQFIKDYKNGLYNNIQ